METVTTRRYRVGRRKVGRADFDAEVARLLRTGLTDVQIAARIGRKDRTAVWRAKKRLAAQGGLKPEEAREAKAYAKLTREEFGALPELTEWIDGLKAMGVAPAKRGTYQSMIRRICEELEIFPAMLDVQYARKWLALHADDRTDAQKREWKIALRSFLSGTGRATRESLRTSGIDAKHHEVGKYATIQLSEEQIARAIGLLIDDPITCLAFRLGSEVCSPLQELQRLKSTDFFSIEYNGQTQRAVRTFRKKTGAYWTKFPAPETCDLAERIAQARQSPDLFQNGDFDRINRDLRQTYKPIGATDPYFGWHPIHALRHVGAQRLLRKNKWNRAVVAKLGGWEAEKTLEDHYGAVPAEVVLQAGFSLWVS